MAAPGGVGKLALGVRPGAGASLKLTTHFEGQPFGVSSHGHAHGHQSHSRTLKADKRVDGKLSDQSKGD